MSTLDILRLEAVARVEGRKASIQGVFMSDAWHYWDSNAAQVPIVPPQRLDWVKPEPAYDYW